MLCSEWCKYVSAVGDIDDGGEGDEDLNKEKYTTERAWLADMRGDWAGLNARMEKDEPPY